MKRKLESDNIINVGFGWSYLLKDGVQIWSQDDNQIWAYDGKGEIHWDRLKDIDAIASKDPSARYLLVQDRALTSQIFERFETGWYEIRNMFGFADDESAEAFQIELDRLKSSKILHFIGGQTVEMEDCD